ncbi:MAG: glucose 1-dehydrogenase [Syntrophales bacterium]|jgi:NAD(P)-dependent dehydrogenase (short-subunit alcohol dehydrogenase family)|nr:glucose 1-dehydrogenase [Syntrophales bacterium]
MGNKVISLSNKIAMVTGAGRGIGKSIALGFAEAGADVVLTSRTLSEIETTADEIKKIGRKALPIVCDVGKSTEVKNLARAAIDEFGQVDILVNNAGISPFVVPIEDLGENGWDKILNINLKGVFLCSQEIGRDMIKRHSGKIINMTSIGGVVGFPGQVAYCVSKAGIIMLTKMFAKEWGKYNINVNGIGPGMVETKLTEKYRDNQELVKNRIESTPLRRFAKPMDIVGGALFLASDLSDYMTGQTIFIDGGRLVA